MYKILEKTPLNPTVTKMVIEAPLVAKKAEPGQFIIFRASEDGERVPLTIADYDRKGRHRDDHLPDRGRGDDGIERPERRGQPLWTLWVRLAHPASWKG